MPEDNKNMDPYKVLGVAKGADDDTIKKAYRQLAKEFHPDRHAGDAKAADRFKEISAAYNLLGSTGSRRRFDAGEIDEWGSERRRGATSESAAGAYSRTADWGRGSTANGKGADAGTKARPSDGEDFFSEFFGKKRGQRKGPASRGMDQTYNLSIDFLTAIKGGTANLTLKNDRAISVKIPAGVKQGQQIRLKGQGAPSARGGEQGDALVCLDIEPHAYFSRDGDDIRLEVPVTLAEAVLGGKINVPTPWGSVSVTVPRGSNTGTVLRLKDKGVIIDGKPKGHTYLTLKIVLPQSQDAELEAFAKRWTAGQKVNVRGAFK